MMTDKHQRNVLAKALCHIYRYGKVNERSGAWWPWKNTIETAFKEAKMKLTPCRHAKRIVKP